MKAARRQPLSVLLLYALAAAGGAAAYVPFLTILLPGRMTEMVGTRDVAVLAYLAFAGAAAASVAHILFGWLSDRSRSRRPWILAGLVLSCCLLISFPMAATPLAVGVTLVAWQFALNMMLAPLAAWAGDMVPDEQKGLLAGLLSLSPAAGALAGALVTLPGLASGNGRLALIAALVALLVLPALLFARPRPMPQLMIAQEQGQASVAPLRRRPDRRIALMWLARLLVQIAEAALFAYILFWFRSLDPAFGENPVAMLFGLVLAGAVPLTLIVGFWSDRSGKALWALIAAAAGAAASLVAMAQAANLQAAIFSYVAFGLASSVFLALHSAQTLRVLRNPATRGRDLGFFNLTNTIPSLIMPWLALGMVPAFGFGGLFLLLSGLAFCAAALLVAILRL